MAELATESLSLNETLNRITEGLTTGDPSRAMSLEDAIILASHHPELQELIEKNAHAIAKIRESGFTPDQKENLLTALFGRDVEPVRDSTAAPERPMSQKEIRERASHLNTALNEIAVETDKASVGYQQRVDRLIEQSVSRFTLRDSDSFIRSMRSRMAEMPSGALLADVRRHTESALSQTLKEHNVDTTREQIQETIRSAEPVIREITNANYKLSLLHDAAPLIVSKARSIGDTRVLSRMITENVANLPNTNSLAESVSEAKATEALGLPPAAAKKLVGGASPSSVLSRAGLTKAASIIANEPLASQGAMISTALLHASGRVEAAINAQTLKIGGATAEALQPIIAGLNQKLSQSGGVAPSLTSQLGGSFFSFSRELSGTDQIVTAYITSVYQKILSPEQIKALGWDNFFTAVIHVNSNSLYPSVGASGQTLLSWLPGFTGKKGMQAGARGTTAIGAKAASGGLRQLFTRLVAAGGFRAIIGKFALSIFGIFTGPVGWLVSLGASFALPAVGGFINNQLSKLFSGQFGPWKAGTTAVLQQFGGARATKSDISTSLMLAFLLLIPVFVLITIAVMVQSVFLGSKAIGLGGALTDTALTYEGGEPPSEISEITHCPTDTGSITQRPIICTTWLVWRNGVQVRVPNTHCRRNAYDIGSISRGSPVYASHGGNVAVAGCDYNNYPGCGGRIYPEWGGFGKFVVLIGRHSDDSVFRTFYAHLDTIHPNVLDGKVEAGEQIGTIDSTGYSSGDHLHFEYRGPRGDAPFLPDSCPFR